MSCWVVFELVQASGSQYEQKPGITFRLFRSLKKLKTLN
jgi:hypothetical protein